MEQGSRVEQASAEGEQLGTHGLAGYAQLRAACGSGDRAHVMCGDHVGDRVSPGFGRALLTLARARAQHVKHVPASGTDLYLRGVPLDETQFREAFAALQAELDQLGPQQTVTNGN